VFVIDISIHEVTLSLSVLSLFFWVVGVRWVQILSRGYTIFFCHFFFGWEMGSKAPLSRPPHFKRRKEFINSTRRERERERERVTDFVS